MIICRAEEITLEEVLDAIHHGAGDVDAVKRMTRSGMGLCQGKTRTAGSRGYYEQRLKEYGRAL